MTWRRSRRIARASHFTATRIRQVCDGEAIYVLAHSLERDLGISSLERVKLLLRLEQAFHVRLPDAVMAEAVTLADVVTAVLRAERR